MNTLSLNQPYLTACVICRDTRSSLWANILLHHFAEVYIIASHSDYRKLNHCDMEGVIIPESKLPKSVDAVFFHSSDELLWKNSHVNSQYIFEFNTPGTPEVKQGILPILRQTAPNFAIKTKDIEEVANYITGKSLNLPLICCKNLELLPAISLLCQAYLAVYSQQPEVCNSSWWLQGLGIFEYNQNSSDRLISLLDSEWQITRKNHRDKQEVVTLINYILPTNTPQEISPDVVVAAYQALNTQPCLRTIDLSLDKLPPVHFRAIFAIPGSQTSAATSMVLSTMLQVPTLFIDENKYRHNWKVYKKAVIVLTQNQLSYIPMLRLEGFSGAVLILSTTHFSLLKQQYRVLRFGEGSHDCFDPHEVLSLLLKKIAELLPLEPENLQFLQKELKAVQKMRNTQITACLANIKQLKKLSPEDELTIKKIENSIEQWRASARVACHTVVNIDNENKQLQQHFQTALNNINIQDNEKRYQAIARLEAAFNHLQDLLQATGEKFISSY
ncbi:hypothetical protein [Nostoc sp. MS1]|uniref:hypothetical protein n=1 Tax=Nostoc sp. MS1 TaxID=2764711 RepID=UPI001CC5CAF6|nr:hypothetical protein [Nostoc sp. MS1]BCL35036.1 hypothetical protein NSMS1_14830 [Nostoc sp. MS1]